MNAAKVYLKLPKRYSYMICTNLLNYSYRGLALQLKVATLKSESKRILASGCGDQPSLIYVKLCEDTQKRRHTFGIRQFSENTHVCDVGLTNCANLQNATNFYLSCLCVCVCVCVCAVCSENYVASEYSALPINGLGCSIGGMLMENCPWKAMLHDATLLFAGMSLQEALLHLFSM